MGYWAFTVYVYDRNGHSGFGQAMNENQAIREAEQSLASQTCNPGPVVRTEVRELDPNTGRDLGTRRY